MTALPLEALERHVDHERRHPGGRADRAGLYYNPGRAAVVDSRGREKAPAVPAFVRYCGPIIGSVSMGPADLRAEAARLLDAADTLEALRRQQTATTADLAGTLFDPDLTT